MFKLISDSVLALYNRVYTNNEWLAKYEYSDPISIKIKDIIEQYLILNKCLLYGSKAVELMIQSKRTNNMFKLKIGDYDVYSSTPKKQIIELYEIIKKQPYVWNARCSFARHHGTSTLYVNDNKIIDFTYMDQNVINNISKNKSKNGLYYISPLISMSSCCSVLSDPESVYMIPKATEKLTLLCIEFPFRFTLDQQPDNPKQKSRNSLRNKDRLSDDIAEASLSHPPGRREDEGVKSNSLAWSEQPFANNKRCEFISKLTNSLEESNDIDEALVHTYFNKLKDTNTPFVLPRIAETVIYRSSSETSENSNNEKIFEYINEHTNLPSFNRYVKPSTTKYFYSGSVAAYVFMSAFSDNIIIGNDMLPKDKILSLIFEQDIEIYVENINVAILKIIKYFYPTHSMLNIEYSKPLISSFPCIYSKAVKLHFRKAYPSSSDGIKDSDQVVYLYELNSQRFAQIVNIQFPNKIEIKNLKCSCYIFLMSHFLFKMSFEKRETDLSNQNRKFLMYSNLVAALSFIAIKNQSHQIFRPCHFSSIYVVGNKKAIIQSNYNIKENSIMRSNESLSDLAINIKYDILV